MARMNSDRTRRDTRRRRVPFTRIPITSVSKQKMRVISKNKKNQDIPRFFISKVIQLKNVIFLFLS